jgi:hypothetical protein
VSSRECQGAKLLLPDEAIGKGAQRGRNWIWNCFVANWELPSAGHFGLALATTDWRLWEECNPSRTNRD